MPSWVISFHGGEATSSNSNSLIFQFGAAASLPSAGAGVVLFDQLPDQPEFIGVLGQGQFG
jgi:hypothetical protein